MNLPVLRAAAGARLDLDALEPGGIAAARVLTVLGERGAVVSVPAGLVAVVCTLAGTVEVASGDSSVELQRSDVLVGDVQARQRIAASPRGACLVVAAAPAAWAALARAAADAVREPLVLFPALHRRARTAAMALLRVAREGRNGCGALPLRQLACALDALQAGFAAMIARCPGSSPARKKSVFLRLQRVRNHIATCAHQELDVARLALMANYSVGHFITTYRAVFDETPYSNVSRYRLQNAGALLSDSTLGIGDIAQAIGFQSRSSFSRAIKKHFGSSATKFRERSTRFRCAGDGAAAGAVEALRGN